MSHTLDSELVDALESSGCTVRGNAVVCAFHIDHNASGSIYTGTDGRSRYKCHGCDAAGDAADIIARHTGRPLAEVLKERNGSASMARIPLRNVQENKPQRSFATVEELAKEIYHQTAEAIYRYTDQQGQDILAVLRLPGKQFRQARWTANGWQPGGVGEPFPLFRQPALAGDVSAVVIITEGEKDADALAALDIMATTAPMGADAVTYSPEKDGKPGKVDWSPLAGRTVVLFGDDDEPGRNHMARVSRCLSRLNPPPMIFMVRVEDHQGCKDAADLIAAHGVDAVRQAIAQAVPWIKPEVVEESASAELTVVTAANLVATHSDYRKPIIEGLLREGETMNIIAAPKVGKSWLVLLLAFCVANGLPFLGRKCAKGEVLIIDNELHPETAAQRLKSVSEAMSVGLDGVHLINLRGLLEDLPTLRKRIEEAALKVGAKVIVLDALYRLLPAGTSENDNAGMMQLYNEIDGIARASGASIIAIHHSSKGNQGEKGVTDGGAGAGSISRAADSHVFLREHEDEGQVVVDAVARSWPPPASIVIGRPNLLWEIVHGADASRIKGRKTNKLSDTFTMEDLVQKFIPSRPEAVATIQARVEGCGLRVARNKLEGLLGLAASSGRIICEKGPHGAKQYGRTASPITESGTLEARAAAYHKEHPGASHAAIAAAVGCNTKTIQRALKAVA